MKKNPNLPILLVDDEQTVLDGYQTFLLTLGYNNTMVCSDSRKVEEILKNCKISIMLMDLSMPHLSGEELLSIINEKYPEIPVIVITGVDDLGTAVRCMKLGAYDFFLKSVKTDAIGATVKRAIENRDLKEQITNLRECVLDKKLSHPEIFADIITNNSKMYSIFRYIEAISASTEPVLITGENGAGKELIAQGIYKTSHCEGKLVAVNVSALDEHQFSDTLFGHKKGAFTGAAENRKGLIEQARGGILFLDEIGDLSPALQVKLLRLIQEKEYYPLGSDLICRSDTRIITATNRDLEKMIEQNLFRKDLYYRLSSHKISIPPLRERIDDLPFLVDHFITKICEKNNMKKYTVSDEAIELLLNHSFPGNIRELAMIINDAIYSSLTEELSMDIIRSRVSSGKENLQTIKSEIISESDEPIVSFPGKLPDMKQVIELLVDEALKRTNGNKARAARMLGITHQAISKRLKKRQESQ